MPQAGTTLVLSDIVTGATQIVTGGLGWLGQTVTTITSNPLLSFWALLGLVGAGIGLYHRLAR